MKRIVLKYAAITLLIAGSLASCSDDSPNEVTGIIIGSYTNGFASILIQVDKKYSIGKTIEYKRSDCGLNLPNSGTYENVIQVQGALPLSGDLYQKIAFSYKVFDSTVDSHLFTIGSGIVHGPCAMPQTPIYVITDYQLLK